MRAVAWSAAACSDSRMLWVRKVKLIATSARVASTSASVAVAGLDRLERAELRLGELAHGLQRGGLARERRCCRAVSPYCSVGSSASPLAPVTPRVTITR